MIQIEDYLLVKTIGKGAYGEVYLTKKVGTNQIFATKKMIKSKVLQPSIRKYFNNEIYILKNTNHPNIIKLYDLKQTKTHFYLIQEYCNGGTLRSCLEKYMRATGFPFHQEIVQHIMRQICSGLEYLHSRNILHRDLKLDNILVNFNTEADRNKLNFYNAQVKIIDFGFARYLKDGAVAASILGSPINMDPKILEKVKRIGGDNNPFGYDQSADIWSLGTLCFELLVGTPPFDGNNYEALLNKINNGQYKIPNELQLSQEAISFINGMLQYNPQKRLDIRELVNHTFLKGNAKAFSPMKINSTLVLNIKKNNDNNMGASVWDMFGGQQGVNPNNINPRMLLINQPLKKYEDNTLKGLPNDYLGVGRLDVQNQIPQGFNQLQQFQSPNNIYNNPQNIGGMGVPAYNQFNHMANNQINQINNMGGLGMGHFQQIPNYNQGTLGMGMRGGY